MKRWSKSPVAARTGGRDPGPAADLSDFILVARLHAAVGTTETRDAPKISETPAFAKRPLGDIGPDESLAFLREADAEVNEIMQVLGVS